ncbi:MAG: hypothetical protein K1X83_04040 [Oligoflexia bacterium]|nr:hypothetical protein [Oligoflexia bacterium]
MLEELVYKLPTVDGGLHLCPLAALEPRSVWAFFKLYSVSTDCRQIAEERARFIQDFVKLFELKLRVDGYGNMVIDVPGRGKGADLAPVIIHTKILPEGAVTPLSPRHHWRGWTALVEAREIEGIQQEVVTAISSDQGAAAVVICTQLELALGVDAGSHRPPLELMFSRSRRSEPLSSQYLDPNFLSGRHLISLDSTAAGQIGVGSSTDPTGPLVQSLANSMCRVNKRPAALRQLDQAEDDQSFYATFPGMQIARLGVTLQTLEEGRQCVTVSSVQSLSAVLKDVLTSFCRLD